MKCFATAVAATLFWVATVCGCEESLLARVTVYWRSENQQRACSNGVALRSGHCAVDPRRIPYGSRVLFPDGVCVAVDTGPDVINRKAARLSGRTAAQRNAIVIDRFFESRREALSWVNAHPQFMTVRVVTKEKQLAPRATVIAKAAPTNPTIFTSANIPAEHQDIDIVLVKSTRNRVIIPSLMTDGLIRCARRRT